MNDWESVKEFYKQNFGIEEWVVELYANLDILQLCASGASNKSIVTFCDIDEDDVVEILMNTFKFPGWQNDLPMNPYKCYDELCIKLGEEGSKYLEATYKFSIGNYIPEELRDTVYNLCKTMKEIEERIADEWI